MLYKVQTIDAVVKKVFYSFSQFKQCFSTIGTVS